MGKIIDSEKVYHDAFEKALKDRQTLLKRSFETDDGYLPFPKLRAFRDKMNNEYQPFVKADDSNFDAYFEEVVSSFLRRKDNYKRDQIKFFLEKDLPVIKNNFISKKDQIGKLKVFKFKEKELLEYLATFLAIKRILKNTEYRTAESIISEENVLTTMVNELPEGLSHAGFNDSDDEYEDEIVSEGDEFLDESKSKGNRDHTARRKVLAMYYILTELKVFTSNDKTEAANFIRFLTGKELNVKEIKNTNIYKYLLSPFNPSEKALGKDLDFIKEYFKKMGLHNIVDKIEKEISSHK